MPLLKIEAAIKEAASQKAQLVCFGETLLPGYPFWLELTDGARFNDTRQKEIFAHYLKEAVSIEQGDLNTICLLAKKLRIAIYIGCADILDTIPYHDLMRQNAPDFLSNGGSCIAAPDGSWVIEPIAEKEAVVTTTIDLNEVRKERHNFDPSGHYARPDVFTLNVATKRQKLVYFNP